MLAAVGLWLGACGDAGPIDESEFAAVPVVSDDVVLADGVGSITDLTAEVFIDGEQVDVSTQFYGEVCSLATDVATCRAEHDRLVATDPEGWLAVGSCPMCVSDTRHLVVLTDVDGARAAEQDEVGPMLAPIESAGEVRLAYGRGVRVRKAGMSWEFIDSEIVEDCDPIVDRTTLYRIDAAGKVKKIRHVDEVSEGCI